MPPVRRRGHKKADNADCDTRSKYFPHTEKEPQKPIRLQRRLQNSPAHPDADAPAARKSCEDTGPSGEGDCGIAIQKPTTPARSGVRRPTTLSSADVATQGRGPNVNEAVSTKNIRHRWGESTTARVNTASNERFFLSSDPALMEESPHFASAVREQRRGLFGPRSRLQVSAPTPLEMVNPGTPRVRELSDYTEDTIVRDARDKPPTGPHQISPGFSATSPLHVRPMLSVDGGVNTNAEQSGPREWREGFDFIEYVRYVFNPEKDTVALTQAIENIRNHGKWNVGAPPQALEDTSCSLDSRKCSNPRVSALAATHAIILSGLRNRREGEDCGEELNGGQTREQPREKKPRKRKSHHSDRGIGSNSGVEKQDTKEIKRGKDSKGKKHKKCRSTDHPEILRQKKKDRQEERRAEKKLRRKQRKQKRREQQEKAKKSKEREGQEAIEHLSNPSGGSVEVHAPQRILVGPPVFERAGDVGGKETDQTPRGTMPLGENRPKKVKPPPSPKMAQSHTDSGSPSVSPSKRVPAGTSIIVPPPLDAPEFGLIQEEVRHNPYHLLVAVVFLQKTKGSSAIPVFRDFIKRWPNPEQLLLHSSEEETREWFLPLGLQATRAKTVWNIAAHFSRVNPSSNNTGPELWMVRNDYRPEDPTGYNRKWGCIIGGIPGCGKYAIDSWRIFCMKPGEGGFLHGTTVGSRKKQETDFSQEPLPTVVYPKRFAPGDEEWRKIWVDDPKLDKELKAYVRWMHAKDAAGFGSTKLGPIPSVY
ncbi:hypothetical protein DRE_00459 [Drechslerella stenobrocha 248]|uniref:HhH-GPD domain-containing protein n=1 Tax=Drechslerella stenobrocha 248 TaxID=1043628 RepID=W7HTP4_9PEZI|nr:hypothetical protein DRE_00459 [Drechslerella stenobrocha 248]